ncbi:MAG: ferredoxin III, nif-specific [Candidatus Accumulibacter phosphatis]|jgi:Nif-specific ferredoxin III|uniref:ferredoxin III, nif-specific n=1 Tax=Candidatus Accumulibacter sp. ACC012 TaxID=2823332 RepID=UPI0025B7D960|nr:ferredoxin III, nif-specific [Candidatus Accumulibacter sp. ACC012]
MITGLTRGGAEWTPQFVTALDQGKCIGCGRCYKVCPRDVLDLVERELDAEDDGDNDDDNTMVMALANAMDCIGCGACGRVCPKDCYTYAPA